MRVLVVGAGLMGAQIGCEYAIGGHEVSLLARNVERASARVADGIGVAESAGLIAAGERIGVMGRLDVRGGVPTVEPDFIVESLPENLDVKAAVLRPLAARWTRPTIATNTSSLPIGALGKAIGAPERTLGTHYWNPPLLMPLVEVIASEATEPSRIEDVVAHLRALGKRPIRVDRDVPGFVWNRLQLALVREAVWLVEQGVAEPAVVDEVVRDGLARRWRLTGPFETMALGGADTFSRIASNLFPELSDATELHGLERWLGAIGERPDIIRRRRDAGLIRELELDLAGRVTTSGDTWTD